MPGRADGTKQPSRIDEKARLLTMLIRDQERRSLSQQIHDTIGQRIVAISLSVERLKKNDLSPSANATVSFIESQAHLIDKELRDISSRLRIAYAPSADPLEPFEELANYWNEAASANVSFSYAGMPTHGVPRDVLQIAFEIAREGLTNAVKHNAGKASVDLALTAENGWCTLTIRDDGRGVDRPAIDASPDGTTKLGLRGMRERAAMLGGVLHIESGPQSGTVVIANLPFSEGNTHDEHRTDATDQNRSR